jgi:catechol 2,3-dioxygenase-like lactoylglutathione lyase family enzyme
VCVISASAAPQREPLVGSADVSPWGPCASTPARLTVAVRAVGCKPAGVLRCSHDLSGCGPEIPAASIDKAVAYYVDTLGFTLDWGSEEGGIAGISREECRLFITNARFRTVLGNAAPMLFWLNLSSKAQVDELYAEWKGTNAKIVSEPEDKAWLLREFIAADPDGNLIRVFYDFSRDL